MFLVSLEISRWEGCMGLVPWLEWNNSHQCTSSGWGRSSRFGDEPKTHPLALPRDFSAPVSAPKFSPHTYSPRPTYFPPSYLPHLISCSLHLQSLEELMSLSNIEFRGDVDTRLEEGGELNVEGIWRGKSKRSASSQMQKGEKITFSTFLFLLYDLFFFVVFFFFFLLFDKR